MNGSVSGPAIVTGRGQGLGRAYGSRGAGLNPS
jgi:hypothetical protein